MLNNDWIPIDVLPPMKFIKGLKAPASNMSENVLCYTSFNEMHIGFYAFNRKKWHLDIEDSPLPQGKVTHWMHLPPPPKNKRTKIKADGTRF